MKIKRVFSILNKHHQPTMLEMFKDYTPFQMVVMTLLSSRTKDTTTIPLVKKLFKKFPRPQDFVATPLADLEKELYGIGFYKVKAKHVKELSKIVLKKDVPDTFEELIKLPGVGRKTANCVLAYTFNKPAIAVDIHVHRIANRLGWVKSETTEETEELLKKKVPKANWIDVNKLLVDHGQRVCLPRKPKCPECPIIKYCVYGQRVLI